ncbi:MAG: efflux RND transporter periplasmic adaptor subunit [Sedimenticola sp.]|uniref:Efflux RND transporter periplasmic adaptor subunit n=1 Tax=Sedimenticola thiotaurini TaxID=1543721 RepID=A0A558D6K2_9GAMM|nr:efflux RND transporter periplasmic adaptor subunit [Sedimenticola sp.]TVT56637.1 MAG: efflux RND transporter periplasmic adaptor subunit [Sedimenticola thiotaurini]MCW8882140.1 efflux RND transporter periplasmic adaptor subunit [Sedimenticola sp.]MCW8920858.1 efflux RND transporter periplasmic adaptor subunit [Sedimenticola sp.]MCW8948009.1 efflux RND transporter periplasmic adaptor subunit [Sedimenticola sp.]
MGIQIHVIALAAAVTVASVLPQASLAQSESDYFTVQQAQGASTVSLGGTVMPYKEVTLSAQVPGRVKHLAGIEGDTFEKGALLVALDDTELLAKRNAALAQLATADAQMRSAGMQYNRELWSPQSKQSMGGMGLPNLFDQMFTRPMEGMSGTRNQSVERRADLYNSGVQITQAQNGILSAQSQIQAIDAKLRDAISLAPFDGVILKKYVEVGDTMQPGQPLLVFADVEYLQIMVDVPASLRPSLYEQMMLQAELDVTGQVVPVRVAQIYPTADSQRHTVKVKFDLPQGVSAPGMYVKVRVPDLTAPQRNHPVIPASAIRYNGSLPGVYVQGKNNRPELRLIRVGESMDNGYVSVLSGLTAGERVLRNPGNGVASGWASSVEKR